MAAALAIAGCAGNGLRHEAVPFRNVPQVGASRDARVEAIVGAVIVRNGPGSWANDASWDEYRIRVRSITAEPICITGVAVRDSSGYRVESRSELDDLLKASFTTHVRYQDAELTVQAGTRYPGWFRGAFGGLGIVVGIPAFTLFAMDRAKNHDVVRSEIRRRQTPLPFTVAGGGEVRLTLFFPFAPSPSGVELVYEDSGGEHVLELDTTAALAGLHLAPQKMK